MVEKMKKWDEYCLMVKKSDLKPIPFQLFQSIMGLDPKAQCEYTDWFWNQRGNYHES